MNLAQTILERLKAAQKLEPKVQPLTPPHRILHNEADLDAWVAEVRKAVLTKLADGPVQL
jgi:hypothetical protein